VSTSLLFVCTGNICRSPTAERLAAMFAAEHPAAGLRVSSAGTHAVVGHGLERTAARVLQTLGGDPGGFRAQHLTTAMVDAADLVLAMTEQHRSRVLELSPRAMRRTFTLREAARLVRLTSGELELGARLVAARAQHPRGDADDDIGDPIGQDLSTFESVGADIAAALRPVLEATLVHPPAP